MINCFVFVVKVLDEEFGIESGLMIIVYVYMNDQKNIDNLYKDLCWVWVCGELIILMIIGVVKVFLFVLLYLKGKFYGFVLCVFVLNVLLVDFVVDLKIDVMVEEVNEVFKWVVKILMYGVFDYLDELFVLIDYNINLYLVVIDGFMIMVMEDRKVKVFVWYDNEWGYLCRVVDLICYVVV